MLYSDNGVTHNYNAKDNTKSNWSTAYFHCGPCPLFLLVSHFNNLYGCHIITIILQIIENTVLLLCDQTIHSQNRTTCTLKCAS